MSELLDIKGRTAFVTGAGQGVGRQVALYLAQHGAGAVVVNDFHAERAESVAAEVETAGAKALPLAFDVSDFEAVGAEAFVAPNRTDQIAFFALQEYATGPFQVEGSVRYENTNVESDTLGIERDFDTFSGALGFAYDVSPAVRTGLNLSRVARAPAAACCAAAPSWPPAASIVRW